MENCVRMPHGATRTLPVEGGSISIRRLFKGEGSSVFLSFDSKRHQFTELILGNGKRYPIIGGFTLRIGKLRIGTNAITGHMQEAYWSISLESHEKPFIMGYSGISELFGLSGLTAVSYLEANQVLSKEWASAVHEYRILPGHKLRIGEREFSGEVIGLTLQFDNPCLNPETVIEIVEKELAKSAEVHPIIEHICGCNCRTHCIEPTISDLGVSVDECLLVNTSDAF